MITKVGYSPRIQARPSQVAFTSRYSSMCSNMFFDNKVVDSHISTMSGNIEAFDSTLKRGASTLSGNIDVESCKVKDALEATSGNITLNDTKVNGDVKVTSGNIRVLNCSSVSGDVSTTTGGIKIEDSTVKGEISVINGKIALKNSNVEGKLISTPDDLILKGKNTIEDLILTVRNKINIYMNNFGSNMIINNNRPTRIIINGVDVTSKFAEVAEETAPSKPVKFTLPSGTTITNSVKFDSKVPGTLLLEKGAKLLGKVINGTVKYLK